MRNARWNGLHRLTLVSGWLAAVIVLASVAAKAGDAEQPAPQCTDDAMLVFDASGSMASAGYNELETPRIFDALEAVRTVLPQVAPYRRIGLMTYGAGAKDSCSNIDQRVAPDYNTDARIIAEIEGLKPDGDTPLSQAVLEAAEALRFREQPAVVVLVTDGDETCGGVPCRVAGMIKSEAFATTVHVIGFKVRDKFFAWQSQVSELERGAVAARCLAEGTGGKYVATETTEELVRALQETLGCPVVTEAKPAKKLPAKRGQSK